MLDISSFFVTVVLVVASCAVLYHWSVFAGRACGSTCIVAEQVVYEQCPHLDVMMFGRLALALSCASLSVSGEQSRQDGTHPTINVRVVEPHDAVPSGANDDAYTLLSSLEGRARAQDAYLVDVLGSLHQQIQELVEMTTSNHETKTSVATSPAAGTMGGTTHFLEAGSFRRSHVAARHVVVGAALHESQRAFAAGEVAKLLKRVDAGGRTASRGLARLVSLTSDPKMRSAMVDAGAVASAETLLKRPDTSDVNVRLAGSLLTLLTGMPVTAEVSDEQSGSHGHVDIVLPRPSRVYLADDVMLEAESNMRA